MSKRVIISMCCGGLWGALCAFTMVGPLMLIVAMIGALVIGAFWGVVDFDWLD